MLEACPSERTSSISSAWDSPPARAAGSTSTSRVEPFAFGGQTYAAEPDVVPVRVDISRTTGNGWALRLRSGVAVGGPCVRCLEPAAPRFEIDAREVEQPGAGDEELSSPYVNAKGELDVAAWARDALALTLPAQITCRPRLRRPVPAVRREPQRGARSTPTKRPRTRAGRSCPRSGCEA